MFISFFIISEKEYYLRYKFKNKNKESNVSVRYGTYRSENDIEMFNMRSEKGVNVEKMEIKTVEDVKDKESKQSAKSATPSAGEEKLEKEKEDKTKTGKEIHTEVKEKNDNDIKRDVSWEYKETEPSKSIVCKDSKSSKDENVQGFNLGKKNNHSNKEQNLIQSTDGKAEILRCKESMNEKVLNDKNKEKNEEDEARLILEEKCQDHSIPESYQTKDNAVFKDNGHFAKKINTKSVEVLNKTTVETISEKNNELVSVNEENTLFHSSKEELSVRECKDKDVEEIEKNDFGEGDPNEKEVSEMQKTFNNTDSASEEKLETSEGNRDGTEVDTKINLSFEQGNISNTEKELPCTARNKNEEINGNNEINKATEDKSFFCSDEKESSLIDKNTHSIFAECMEKTVKQNKIEMDKAADYNEVIVPESTPNKDRKSNTAEETEIIEKDQGKTKDYTHIINEEEQVSKSDEGKHDSMKVQFCFNKDDIIERNLKLDDTDFFEMQDESVDKELLAFKHLALTAACSKRSVIAKSEPSDEHNLDEKGQTVEPPIQEKTENTQVKEKTDKLLVEEETEKFVVAEKIDKLQGEEKTEQCLVTEKFEELLVTKQTEKPAAEDKDENTSVSEKTEKTSVEGKTVKTLVNKKNEKSLVKEKNEKFLVEEKTENITTKTLITNIKFGAAEKPSKQSSPRKSKSKKSKAKKEKAPVEDSSYAALKQLLANPRPGTTIIRTSRNAFGETGFHAGECDGTCFKLNLVTPSGQTEEKTIAQGHQGCTEIRIGPHTTVCDHLMNKCDVDQKNNGIKMGIKIKARQSPKVEKATEDSPRFANSVMNNENFDSVTSQNSSPESG